MKIEADVKRIKELLELNKKGSSKDYPEEAKELGDYIKKYRIKAMNFLRDECGIPPVLITNILIEASVVSSLTDDQDEAYVDWLTAIMRMRVHKELLMVLYDEKIKRHCLGKDSL